MLKQVGKQLNRFAEETEKGLDIAVVIYFDTEYNEYQVHSWNPNPKSRETANFYHTDDKDDAVETAKFILRRGI